MNYANSELNINIKDKKTTLKCLLVHQNWTLRLYNSLTEKIVAL